MKSVLALAVAALMVASASAVQLEAQTGAEVEGNCFPQCTWNCDQPSCPAVCEPQCEKPSCELRCEKLPATSCDIRCEKPQCEVRCSKSNCQSGGCPMCENVCMPAKCQTVCTPSTPVCKPTCSAPKCTWSCRKPLTCPKPKCNLGCAGSSQASTCSGGAAASFLEQKSCCSCQEFNNMQTALEMATRAHVAKHGAEPSEDLMPSFVEVAHSLRLDEQLSGEAKCCPCSA